MREGESGDLAVNDQTAEVKGVGRGAVGFAGVGREPDGKRTDSSLVTAIGVGVGLAAVHHKGEREVTGDRGRKADRESAGPGFSGGKNGDGEGGPQEGVGGFNQFIAAPEQGALDRKRRKRAAVGHAHGDIEELAGKDSFRERHELGDKGGAGGHGRMDVNLVIHPEVFGAGEDDEVTGGGQTSEGDATGGGVDRLKRSDEGKGIGAIETGRDGRVGDAPRENDGIIPRARGRGAEHEVIGIIRIGEGKRGDSHRTIHDPEIFGRDKGVIGLGSVGQEGSTGLVRRHKLIRPMQSIGGGEYHLFPESLLEDAEQGGGLDLGLDRDGESKRGWARVGDGDGEANRSGERAGNAKQAYAAGLHLALKCTVQTERVRGRISDEPIVLGQKTVSGGGAKRKRGGGAGVELHPRPDGTDEALRKLDLRQREIRLEGRLQLAGSEFKIGIDFKLLVFHFSRELDAGPPAGGVSTLGLIVPGLDHLPQGIEVFTARTLRILQEAKERGDIHLDIPAYIRTANGRHEIKYTGQRKRDARGLIAEEVKGYRGPDPKIGGLTAQTKIETEKGTEGGRDRRRLDQSGEEVRR